VAGAELAVTLQQAGGHHGGDGAGTHGQEGVQDCVVLGISRLAEDGHEAGPEDPEDECPHEGQEVGAGCWGLLGVHRLLPCPKESLGHTEAKIAGEDVDCDGAPHVQDPQMDDDGPLVDEVDGDFADGQDEEMTGAGPPQDGSHGDEHCHGGKLSGEEVTEVQVDLAVVEVMEQALQHQRPLRGEVEQQEVMGEGTETVAGQERQQEPQPHHQHHLDVLEEGEDTVELVGQAGILRPCQGLVVSDEEGEEEEQGALEEPQRERQEAAGASGGWCLAIPGRTGGDGDRRGGWARGGSPAAPVG